MLDPETDGLETDISIHELREQLEDELGPHESRAFDLKRMRADLDDKGAKKPLPRGVTVELIELAGRKSLRIVPPCDTKGRAILYLHGGGYQLGSPISHRSLAAHFAEAAQATVYLLGYRRAPEDPYPAALKDATTAWTEIIKLHGHLPSKTSIVGDGSGGGLAIATAIALNAAGAPKPSSLILLSPWVHMGQVGATWIAKLWDDPLNSKKLFDRHAKSYLGDKTVMATPLASPVMAPMTGLPPMLIHVGTEEVLLGDADLLVAAARKAGVEVVLEVWREMIHAWHWHHDVLFEAREAIVDIGTWLMRRWG
jgi:epsilon-lactone hydrolase